MNKLAPLFRFFLKVLAWFVALNVIHIAVILFGAPFSGSDLVMERLLFGFITFLRENTYAISWNARTWGPGLAAFVIALMFVHRYLSRWARKTGRRWGFPTSLCLLMIVPVLFVIPFIVPGVLLQWEMLREVVWIDVR